MSFTQSKIHLDVETISEQLRSSRQGRGLKLEKVARETRINIKYLDALEKGRFELLPRGVYGKNYLTEYANYLKLNTAQLLDLFDEEVAPMLKNRQTELFNTQVVKRHYFLSFPKILRGILIGLLVLIAGMYLAIRLRSLIAPPTLIINKPADNELFNVSSVELQGNTEPETQLIVNGEEIISDAYGRFTENINLKKGINFITITAKKKYGREKTEVRRVLRN
jgi:transcriptional regulator with XRE-family HTH domain